MEKIKKIQLTDEDLAALREQVKERMDEKRYRHTLGVEKEASCLSQLFMSEEEKRLRAAALLHDITKQVETQKQLKICEEFGIMVGRELLSSPKLFHAVTGAAVAEREFSAYGDPQIIEGVRYHTTGRAGMSLFEAIIYLADYIEETRTFEDCVELRAYFYQSIKGAETLKEKKEVLRKTMVLSFDMTMKNLMAEHAPIDRNTVEARNWFLQNKDCF